MPGASWAAQVALLQKAVEGLLTPRPQALISFDFRGRNSVVAVGEGDQVSLAWQLQLMWLV